MLETFRHFCKLVPPVFWPVLWLNLAIVYARYADDAAYIEIRVSWFGTVRVSRVLPDPQATWRDDLWDAVDRVRPKGNAPLIMPPAVRIAATTETNLPEAHAFAGVHVGTARIPAIFNSS
ncbi:MAG: hypothetical protein AAFQ85_03730 [Pseudomonadota bacterium]